MDLDAQDQQQDVPNTSTLYLGDFLVESNTAPSNNYDNQYSDGAEVSCAQIYSGGAELTYEDYGTEWSTPKYADGPTNKLVDVAKVDSVYTVSPRDLHCGNNMSIYFESQQGEFETDSDRVSDVLGFSEEDIEMIDKADEPTLYSGRIEESIDEPPNHADNKADTSSYRADAIILRPRITRSSHEMAAKEGRQAKRNAQKRQSAKLVAQRSPTQLERIVVRPELEVEEEILNCIVVRIEASEGLPLINDDEMQSVDSGGIERADGVSGAFQNAPGVPGGTQFDGSFRRSAIAGSDHVGGSRDLHTKQFRQFPLHDQRGEGTFQCTFCRKRIANKYNWIDHEEAHLELSTWVCAPDGFIDPKGRCVFCEDANCRKEYHKKCEYNRNGRTFTRKKYFQTHLPEAHQLPKGTKFNHWKMSVAPPNGSRCGFCGETFTDWKERMKHVALELENGKEMGQWNGDWGLAEGWMIILRNDTTVVPPNNSSDEAATSPVVVHTTQRPRSPFSYEWIHLTRKDYE
ncbi:hypothetical protein BDD12DRAFT_909370 [Trichophaea hybrida]|nr:hypothetical protein BDD12DRAFT_909370 [Trichophaea hybrida]